MQERFQGRELEPSEESAIAKIEKYVSLGRSIAGFTLNFLAAAFPALFLGTTLAYRFLRVYLPSLSAAERELLVSVVAAALVAFGVSKFWTTTTAKWIWMLPVPLLLVRMAMVASGGHQGSVLAEHPYSVWKHFFNPELSRLSITTDPKEIMDFLVYTLLSVKATTYSLVAWASSRWDRARVSPDLSPAVMTPSSPAGPVIWPKERLQWFTATNLLIGINVVVFAATAYLHGDVLREWGANFGYRTQQREYWRLLTYSFLHLNILHLASNMLVLWWLGRWAEKIFGPLILTGIYVLTAIGAGLLSLAVHPWLAGQGASGSLLGMAGVLLTVVWYGRVKVPAQRLLYRRIVIFILYMLISGFAPFIDNVAHLGGLAAGLLLGLGIALSLRKPSSHAFPMVRLFQGREALASHDYDAAVHYLQTYISLRPNDSGGHALLGCSLHSLARYDEAAQEYRQARTLGCMDAAIEDNLAEIQPFLSVIQQAET